MNLYVLYVKLTWTTSIFSSQALQRGNRRGEARSHGRRRRRRGSSNRAAAREALGVLLHFIGGASSSKNR
jgi:hypothetical protein